jgi:hypothetical protein
MSDLSPLTNDNGNDEQLNNFIRTQSFMNSLAFVDNLYESILKKDPTLNFFINIEKGGLGHKSITEMLDFLQENTQLNLNFSQRRKQVNGEIDYENLTEKYRILLDTVRKCHEIASNHRKKSDYEVIKELTADIIKHLGESFKPKE